MLSNTGAESGGAPLIRRVVGCIDWRHPRLRYLTPASVMKERLKGGAPNWRIAVICFRDLRGSKQMIDVLEAEPVGRKVLYGLDELPDAPFVYEMEVRGEQVGVVTRCVWGGPQAAIMVEELAFLGVEYVVGCGAAGSIDRSLLRGEQIIGASAPVIDGTSRCYRPPGDILQADPRLASVAESAARDLGGIQRVSVGTVDALYRETEELIGGMRARGLQAVNMETAAFYAACLACGVTGLWIGHVSDTLFDGVWKDWSIDRDEMTRSTAAICARILSAIADEVEGVVAQ